MKSRHWSLAIVLILVNYIIFATLFTRLLQTDFNLHYVTRTPAPTFTPAPVEPPLLIPTPTPVTPVPTPTATRVLEEAESQAHLLAPASVNIRSGPGPDYAVIGTLNAETTVPIVGRAATGDWWQIRISAEERGWVSAEVVSAYATESVPVVQADTSTFTPQTAASKSGHRFEPTAWDSETDPNATRFFGMLADGDGNPINDLSVRARCGNYTILSDPSGQGADWPDGFYDIVADTRPVPCIWVLTVVETADDRSITAELSAPIPVEVTEEKSVIIANWRRQ